ncbi:MAG: DUF1573 domain-containing protein [Patescibacteria group bacterium]
MKDQNKIIMFIAVLAVLFIGLFIFAKPGKNENKETNIIPNATSSISALKALETFYDFGTISMKNGNVSKIFKVTNPTNLDIFIPNLTTSCMCTNAYFVQSDGNRKGPFGMIGMGFVPKLNETIKAGESREIEVVFNPNAHGPAGVGLIDRFVYLADNSNNSLQFEIKAKVTP